MVKEEFEMKEVTKTEKVVISRKICCDICEKEITDGSNYYEVKTHHNDWGNDSHESYEYFDICGNECVVVKLNEYFQNGYIFKDIEIHQTIST